MDDLIQAARDLSGYESVKEFLYGLRYRGAKYGLERMHSFAALFGNPHLKFPSIHVAGTNGKGSTCAMLERIFRAHGYKTGLFSSPHLIRQGERIQVNREILDESEIVRLTKHMVSVLLEDSGTTADNWPSFFEFMTMMAFIRFAESEVEIALIETGLGGRLDATNILKPCVSVITSISYDHTHILGDTLEKIAFEKAGIIKQSTPVVIGKIPEAAEKVIREISAERGCEVQSVSDRFGPTICRFPETNLVGEYQRINAATSLLACHVIESHFSGKFMLEFRQKQKALKSVDWPGRWETVELPAHEKSRLILDSTHNQEGARMLDKNLQSLLNEEGQKPVIVVGTLGEDRGVSLLDVVCKYADRIHLVHPKQPRALTFEELRKCLPDEYEGEVVESTVDELFDYQRANVALKPKQTLIVTGSIYLIGEVSDRIKSPKKVNQQRLQDVI